MKSNFFRPITLAFLLFSAATSSGQTTVPIPYALDGTTFDLTVKHGTSEIFPGIQTNTIGYNGSQLGPTLILKKGETVTLDVTINWAIPLPSTGMVCMCRFYIFDPA